MKISVLVPAYKTKYINSLLLGFQSQTVKPDKIVFSDDSPSGEFSKIILSDEMAPLRDGLPIEIIDGPRNGPSENTKNLLDFWNKSSDLFHILLDDDIIFPEFYEHHLKAHISGDFSCSITSRWESNEVGQPTRGQPIPSVISESSSKFFSLDADFLFLTTVCESKNWLGEFSNVVFRGDQEHIIRSPSIAGISYAGLWDLGAFVALSMIKPVCYVHNYLGCFRKNPYQHSAQVHSPMLKAAFLAYIALAIAARRIGKISDEASALCFIRVITFLKLAYPDQEDVQNFVQCIDLNNFNINKSEIIFLALWDNFLNHNNLH